MFTSEFEAAMQLDLPQLKGWLRLQRNGVKFKAEIVPFVTAEGNSKQRAVSCTPNRLLCAIPAYREDDTVPYSFALGHVPTGKLLFSRAFPRLRIVESLVVALEDSGLDFLDPHSISSREREVLFDMVQRVYVSEV